MQLLKPAATLLIYFTWRAAWLVISAWLFIRTQPASYSVAEFAVRHWVGIIFICPVYITFAAICYLNRLRGQTRTIAVRRYLDQVIKQERFGR